MASRFGEFVQDIVNMGTVAASVGTIPSFFLAPNWWTGLVALAGIGGAWHLLADSRKVEAALAPPAIPVKTVDATRPAMVARGKSSIRLDRSPVSGFEQVAESHDDSAIELTRSPITR